MKNTELKNITALDEIAAIISGNDSPKAMMNRLDDYHGSDISEVICTLTVQNRKKFYRVCSLEMLAEIFEYLEEKQAGKYLSEMDIHKAAELIAELDTDTAVNILAETDKDRRSLILEAVEPAIRTELRLIASFDDDEIGSRMTTNCIIIGEDMSVKQAMNAPFSWSMKATCSAGLSTSKTLSQRTAPLRWKALPLRLFPTSTPMSRPPTVSKS